MMAATHVIAGSVCALLAAKGIGATPAQTGLVLTGGILGSLLPDIDHPKSWLGRRLAIISIPLSSIVGHRGVTHSMIALIVMQAVILGCMWWWRETGGSGWLAPVGTGIGLGYASHLLADWLSNSGVPLLWPNRKRFAAPITISTGSATEYVFTLGLVAWLIFLARGLFNA